MVMIWVTYCGTQLSYDPVILFTMLYTDFECAWASHATETEAMRPTTTSMRLKMEATRT
jgi:hypothetical protein